MDVNVDPKKCIGCALCADNLPEIFSMDGYVAVVTSSKTPEHLEEELRATVEDCPSEAIFLI